MLVLKVGFGMASILDGQVTGLGRAMRVHKDFRNLGIFKRLSQHMHSFYRLVSMESLDFSFKYY